MIEEWCNALSLITPFYDPSEVKSFLKQFSVVLSVSPLLSRSRVKGGLQRSPAKRTLDAA
jgi:hypothetical protein